MKVLMCTYYAPGLVDGASASGHSLARHLRNQGTEVTLCTTDLGWPPEQKQPPRQENMRVFHAWFASGLEIARHFIPTAKQPAFFSGDFKFDKPLLNIRYRSPRHFSKLSDIKRAGGQRDKQ